MRTYRWRFLALTIIAAGAVAAAWAAQNPPEPQRGPCLRPAWPADAAQLAAPAPVRPGERPQPLAQPPPRGPRTRSVGQQQPPPKPQDRTQPPPQPENPVQPPPPGERPQPPGERPQPPAERPQPPGERPQPPWPQRPAPPALPPDAPVKVIRLQYSNGGELLQAIRGAVEAMGQQAVLSAYNEVLIIAASDEATAERIVKLVREVDAARASLSEPSGFVTEGLTLKSAAAHEVVEALRQLRGDRTFWPRIIADQRSNSVWLSGDGAEVKKYLGLAQELDQRAAGRPVRAEARRQLRFYRLQHAQAPPLSQTVNGVLASMDADLHVVADQQSGTLIAFATDEQHSYVETLVKTLDVARATPPAGENR